ncbi:MAG: hypothetical protein SFV55_21210 [Haliscomenobacter sp.]|uniref:hypothetical protein n=1 Tax=Haliscomenobacter sp. TaxID=2717303 RepID=UPI0029A41973|nr:hypothetical protein [Haliscomenobacter sp.]MDX2070962.1 hypothetical protein [Haliscomenobacter sp.]
MPLKADLFGVIILLGIAQGLFLAFFFASRKVKNGQNAEFWLILLLLCFALNLFEILMCHSNLAFEFRYFPDKNITLIFLNNQNNGAYDDLKRNVIKLITDER